MRGDNLTDKRPEARFTAWTVTLHGRLIDVVFYDVDCNADYVRRTLVEHDGYDPEIRVRPRAALDR